MAGPGAIADARTLSDLLAGIDLQGRTWCYSDVAQSAGFSVAPGDAVLFHAVLHGTARIACAGGTMVELGAGEAVLVLSGEAHAIRTAPASPVHPHEFLRDERLADVPPSLAIGSGPVVARILSGRLKASWPGEVNRANLPPLLQFGGETPASLLQATALPMAGVGAGSAALLTRIAAMMLVDGLRADPSCRLILSPDRQDPIGQAMRLIRGNPSASWTVERLARSVGMGRSNFAAHFTQAIGRAPMEVVAEQRMEHAASLLRQGKLKIAEISEMAGYGSEAAFSRRFTRHFGISPSQMRERERAAPVDKPAKPGFRQLLASRPGKGAAFLGRKAGAVRHGGTPRG